MILDSETGYAKINLALHVRRREADGYHAIETLFAFVDGGDLVHLTDVPGLTMEGPFAGQLSGERDNLVVKAAQAFGDATGIKVEVGFHLDKRLPVASGIGGGSADAAAVLRLLCRHYDRDVAGEAVLAVARALGADVPACLASQTSRGTGRGDLLVAAGRITGSPILLVNPGRAISTAKVFAGWDGNDRGPLLTGAPLEVALAGRNDLEAPALGIEPAIGEVLRLLQSQEGPRLVRMSGSGATCFGMFDDVAARDEAAKRISASRPDWWTLASVLR